jgi:undecaprenyl-diphosphatase
MSIVNIDFAILDFIQAQLRNGFGDVFFPAVSFIANRGIVWILLALILIIIPKTRKLGLTVALSLALEALLCNVIIKPLVARTRPFDINTAIELLIAKPRDFSFPSGHTGASFAVASALFFKKSKLYIPTGILAILIAFSRLYLYVHYPSDVICGAILGILSGFIVCLLSKNNSRYRSK